MCVDPLKFGPFTLASAKYSTMPTITEVSDEVPVAVPSDGTEDVVQGHVVEQEGKSNDSDDESADDSSSSTTSDEDQSDSSSNLCSNPTLILT